MITTTHVVTNAFVARWKRRSGTGIGAERSTTRWFVFGGLAPDLGLFALSVGAFAFYPLVRGLSFEETGRLAFDDLFYNDPLWLTLQNTLHSPVVVGALAIAGRALGRQRLLSFALGCMLHTAVDIPVHHNDGPLVFFPFNWSYRFSSPVSYWDPDHFGQFVAPLDMAITVLGGGYLLTTWWRNRRAEQ